MHWQQAWNKVEGSQKRIVHIGNRKTDGQNDTDLGLFVSIVSGNM